jgi:CheY-like chemotaxis protein
LLPVETPLRPVVGERFAWWGKAMPLRILVVDDHADNAESWAVLFRLVGHEVLTASDGLEAIAAAAVHLPHVVFLDLTMPKLDGFGAAHLLANQPNKPVLVALSARDDPVDRRRCQEVGFDHVFTKPADPLAILQLLADIELPP